MKIQPFTIDEIRFIVKPVNRPDNLRALCQLHILKNNGDTAFKVKGFTLREKVFRSGTVLALSFPAIRGGMSYFTSFIVEDKNLWQSINDGFVDEYESQTNPDGYSQEGISEIKDDDIPF